MADIEKTFYEQYVSTQHEEEARSHQQELVKKLLEKLPESERTVMTLYYLGEMTAKEIGKFLGVSVNTITSRLQRARKRLQQDEELLVQEMLGSVQLSESLTQNIVRKVADMKLPRVSFNRETVTAVGGFWCSCGPGDATAVRFEQSIPRPISEAL